MVEIEFRFGAMPWRRVPRLVRLAAPWHAWSALLVVPAVLLGGTVMWAWLMVDHGPDPINVTVTIASLGLAASWLIGAPWYTKRRARRVASRAGLRDESVVHVRFDADGVHIVSPVEAMRLPWARLGPLVHLDGAAGLRLLPGSHVLVFPATREDVAGIEALRGLPVAG